MRTRKELPNRSKLTWLDFKLEYGDLVVLLNQIMGVAQGMQFENSMYYFIDEIENGIRKFD